MADSNTTKSIDGMKVAELAAELQKRGLSKSGKKSDLIKRLKKNIEENSPMAMEEQASSTASIVNSSLLEISDEVPAQPDSSTSTDNVTSSSQVEPSDGNADGDTLEVHLQGNELGDFAQEDSSATNSSKSKSEDKPRRNSRSRREDDLPAKRRKLNVRRSASTVEADPGVPSVTAAEPSADKVGRSRDSSSDKKQPPPPPLGEAPSREGEDTEEGEVLEEPEQMDLSTSVQSSRPRSISIEVDPEYEQQRIRKEKEREELRQQIEAKKKEEARLGAKKAEEKRHQREEERESLQKQRESEMKQREEVRQAKQQQEEEVILVRQVSEKKKIEDIRKEAKERRLKSGPPASSSEVKLALSPPHGAPSNVLHVLHLTRPFTQPQLEEMLNLDGGLLRGQIWTDRKKSHCYCAFYTVEAAVAAAERVHGLKWPSHNRKYLEVEYATAEQASRETEHQLEAPEPLPRACERIQPLPEPTPSAAQDSAAVTGARGPGGNEGAEGLQQDQEGTAGAPSGTEGLGTGERVSTRDKLSAAGNESPLTKSASTPAEQPVGGDAKTGQDPTVKQAARPRGNPPPVAEAEEDEESSPLDKLFRKTKALPHIYWLPLTEERAGLRELERKRAGKDQAVPLARIRSPQIPLPRKPSPRPPAPPRRPSPRRRSPPRDRSPRRPFLKNRSPRRPRSPQRPR